MLAPTAVANPIWPPGLNLDPEKKLALVVIERALEDLATFREFRPHNPPTKHERLVLRSLGERRDLEDWLSRPHDRSPGGLGWWAELGGGDAGAITVASGLTLAQKETRLSGALRGSRNRHRFERVLPPSRCLSGPYRGA